MISGKGGGPPNSGGNPTGSQNGHATVELGEHWNSDGTIRPGQLATPMRGYGDYGYAPPGMNPNTFNTGHAYRESGGQQNAAFDPALAAYNSTLGGAQTTATNLANSNYDLQSNAAYAMNPDGLGQQMNGGGQQAGAFNTGGMQQAGQFAPGQLFSGSMDPMVAQQMGQAQQQNTLQARSVADQIAASAGDNKALAGAMRGRGMQDAMLANNQLRTDFMGQQANRDMARRQASESAYGQNLQGMNQNNQASLQGYGANLQGMSQNNQFNQQAMAQNNQARQAEEQLGQSAYGQNVANAGMANQSEAQKLGARTGAAAPQMNMLGQLGQQLPAFANQFDNADLQSLGATPDGSGGGK